MSHKSYFCTAKKISMASFHKLRIKDIKQETADCVSLVFDIPSELKDEFRYTQGQYLTLKHMIDGEDVRRSYSACSSPVADTELRIAVKHVADGKMSTYLNNGISTNDSLEVMKPMGNFYTEMTPGTAAKHYVAFAAGSGITPILSILKTALAVNAENKFTLVYGNKSATQTIFKAELDQLQAANSTRFDIHYINSQESHSNDFYNGRISPEKCLSLLDKSPELKQADEFFLCGPFDMIMATKDALKANGVAEENVHFELFTTADAPASTDTDEGDGSHVDSKVTIILDGDEMEIDVPVGESILDAALDAGLDAPYACTGGSCCTCRAKAESGKAEMDVNYALTDSEVKEGYILTCQSHPTTKTMVVDYDAS